MAASGPEIRKLEAEARMTADACRLDEGQRKTVNDTIRKHCEIRGWILHAVNCRTNHLHVVVTANRHPRQVRLQFKAWCTRRLKELDETRGVEAPIREEWWAERGSQRYINDEPSLEAATLYVRDGQDQPH
jgi:REP element-mobilizing transposase RayT